MSAHKKNGRNTGSPRLRTSLVRDGKASKERSRLRVGEHDAGRRLMTNISEAMRARGWTNADLARAFQKVAGITLPLSTMTGWFGGNRGGRRLPQAKFLLHLARVLDVETRWLFDGEGPMQRKSADQLAAPEAEDLLDDVAAFGVQMRKKYGARSRRG